MPFRSFLCENYLFLLFYLFDFFIILVFCQGSGEFRVVYVGFRVVPVGFRAVPGGSGRFPVGSMFYIHQFEAYHWTSTAAMSFFLCP